tara:strand:- start:206 stop:400 length:195 start_codon:yes stop_codon:yes gene_type:complete
LKNPCADICKFNKPNGYCNGCGLLKKESKNWKKYRDVKRKNILLKLPSRLKELDKTIIKVNILS